MVSIIQEVGWVSGLAWTGAETFASTGVRFLHHPSYKQPAVPTTLYWSTVYKYINYYTVHKYWMRQYILIDTVSIVQIFNDFSPFCCIVTDGLLKANAHMYGGLMVTC
jgi:hypothetical protein